MPGVLTPFQFPLARGNWNGKMEKGVWMRPFTCVTVDDIRYN